MLSADVPEFVPRAYTNQASPSNTTTSKPDDRPTQPQKAIFPSRSQKLPGSGFGATRAPENSWRQGRESQSTFSRNFPKQNDIWRKSGKESGSWRAQARDVNRCEGITETFPETFASPRKMSEKQNLQKGRGRGKPMSTEDLESHIRSKFIASKNMTNSYTRILKNSPKNSKPEATESKQDFSLSVASQWPTLGGVQPQSTSNQNIENTDVESISNPNPWISRSSEVSPTKSPTKNSQNPWQEKGAAKPAESPAVRPKTTKESHKSTENAAKQKRGKLDLQRGAEIRASFSDRRSEGSRHSPVSQCKFEPPKIQSSNVRNTLNPEDDNSAGVCKHEDIDKGNQKSAADEKSDPFQWKVIGEKKKKARMKEEETHGSSKYQELRGDGKKQGRDLVDQPSPTVERKQVQAYSNVTKNVLKNKNIQPYSRSETHAESKNDVPIVASCLKEGKKSRPTMVSSLANCSADKREMRSALKKSTAEVATKPVDEELLQKKLAAKILKQEAKKKKRELKAQQALVQNRQRNTRVSLITTDFLEKTQRHNQKTYNQMSTQEGSEEEEITFTSEEYPSLQMQRDKSQRPPLSRMTQPKTTHRPDKTNKDIPSTQVKVQGKDLVQRYKDDTATPVKDVTNLEEHVTTYRTALLAAREKEAKSKPVLNTTEVKVKEVKGKVPTQTTMKKNVKTTDRIELDLFALATHTVKKKKKELANEHSPTKKKQREDHQAGASKTGLAAHSLLNKGATVVVKRGKISTNPKKKKISRIKKCKVEKRQRDVLALQLLLQQAKLKVEQQNTLEAPQTIHTKAEDSCKEVDSIENNNIADLRCSTLTDQEEDDNKERQSTTSEIKPAEEEYEANARNSEIPLSILNTNVQINNITPNNTQSATQNSDLELKADSIREEKPMKQQLTEGGSPTSAGSLSHEDLINDPLVVQRASQLISLVKSHGRREYIHQVVTPEVNAVAKELMTSLIAFQARHYQREPIKARMKRRYVCGLKETTKLMGKMSCVIMAPNIEQCEGPGSLDDAVEKLLNQAEKHKVPVVFALSMRLMKRLCHKSGKRVSCFGIINYQGAQDLFKRLMELLPEAQKQYQQLVACGQCSIPKGDEEENEEEKKGNQEEKEDLTEEIIARTNALLLAP